MKDFRELKVWHKAHQLVLAVYEATQRFPDQERYGLTSQLRRSAASIGSNIAEGCGRRGDAELARCLQIALGSASEVEYQLLLARDLALLTGATHQQLHRQTTEVKKMLATLVNRLRAES